MSKDLGFSASVFGGAAGIFFIAYFFFEVPSNLALDKVGARIWIARIMLTWGLIAGAEAFVRGPTSLYAVRLLLGAAEAGFFPGIIFFLTLWFPSAYRARIVGLFMFAIPISTVIGAPISGALLNLDGWMGLKGWQWMFIIEAVPALLMSVVVFFYLTDRPPNALWLDPEERQWLRDRLAAEQATRERHGAASWLHSMIDPRVIALGFVYMGCNIPQYGLSFFLPQIVKAFGLTNVQAGFVTALPYAVGAVGMILWSRHSDATKERKWHAIVAARHHRGRLAGGRECRRSDDQDGVPLRRGIRLLRGAAGVLDAADVVPQRERGSGRHRGGQFDRQSRRLFRAADLRLSQGHEGRIRKPRLPRGLRADRRGDRIRAGPQSRTRAPDGGRARGGVTISSEAAAAAAVGCRAYSSAPDGGPQRTPIAAAASASSSSRAAPARERTAMVCSVAVASCASACGSALAHDLPALAGEPKSLREIGVGSANTVGEKRAHLRVDDRPRRRGADRIAAARAFRSFLVDVERRVVKSLEKDSQRRIVGNDRCSKLAVAFAIALERLEIKVALVSERRIEARAIHASRLGEIVE